MLGQVVESVPEWVLTKIVSKYAEENPTVNSGAPISASQEPPDEKSSSVSDDFKIGSGSRTISDIYKNWSVYSWVLFLKQESTQTADLYPNLSETLAKSLRLDSRDRIRFYPSFTKRQPLLAITIFFRELITVKECRQKFQQPSILRNITKLCQFARFEGPIPKPSLLFKYDTKVESIFSSEQNYSVQFAQVFQRSLPSEQEKKKSQQLIEQQDEDVQLVSHELHEALEEMNGTFILFDDKDDKESDLSILPFIFTTGKRESYKLTFDLDFDEMVNTVGKTLFIRQTKAKLSKEMKVREDDIIVREISRGSVNLIISTIEGVKDLITRAVPDAHVSPLAKAVGPVLQLHVKDFDSRGNVDNFNGSHFVRGGLDYLQPSAEWKRIGLNVLGKYDRGNDDWLAMDGREGEWAVGFHGCRTLEGSRSISKGRNFKAGARNRCQNDEDINTLGSNYRKPCGIGAYFAQNIETSGRESFGLQAEIEGEKSTIVFQVRLNPKTVRIPSGNPEYLIAPDEESARPYGICVRKYRPDSIQRQLTINTPRFPVVKK